jgi:hypothetical protein
LGEIAGLLKSFLDKQVGYIISPYLQPWGMIDGEKFFSLGFRDAVVPAKQLPAVFKYPLQCYRSKRSYSYNVM